MKAATAYERGGKIFLHASSESTDGVWLASHPFFSIPKENLDDLNDMIQDCLHGSMQGIPHPLVWAGLFDPILNLAGVKSIRTFNRLAKCVEIEAVGGVIKFIPTHNKGGDGFTHLPHLERSVSDRSNQLGAELISAFEDAK